MHVGQSFCEKNARRCRKYGIEYNNRICLTFEGPKLNFDKLKNKMQIQMNRLIRNRLIENCLM